MRLIDSETGRFKHIVAVYVVDMIVAGSDSDCECLREGLIKLFPVNDLDPLSWYTGCAFEYNKARESAK